MVGRIKERNQLVKFLNSKNRACIVYGRRRIGKSYLIQNTLLEAKCRFIYFECVEASIEVNLRLFCTLLGINPVLPYATFLDVFREIGKRRDDVVIVIDEYQNLKKKDNDADIDSLMQNAIDQSPDNVKIIICGSYVTAMRKLLEEDNPLFGRFKPIIHLEAMDYLDSSLFYPSVGIREKIGFYSVFGGSPYINDSITEEDGLKQNIIDLILEQDSVARNYIENQLFRELKKLDGINEILSILSNGKKSYSDIQTKLIGRSSGYAAERLSVLENMGVVKKFAPINDPDNKKRLRYEITDNLLRFYYAYVFPNKSVISILGGDTFYDSYIAKSINTFISYRFEQISREYFSRLARKGLLDGILNIGTYSYGEPKEKKNGEFDVALKYEDGYDIFEVKYLEEKMGNELIEEEKRKIENIPFFSPRNIGMVSSSGFEEEMGDVILLSGDDLYDNTLFF